VSDETYDLYQQGRAHLRKGRAAQATVALEKAKRREPQKASIREALGIAYLRIQRYPEAEEEFRAMLELSPADHYAHYALGRALEKQGKESEANGHYKLASSLRPQNEHYASRIRDLDADVGDEEADASEPGSDTDADDPAS
jgi:Flp pilus assembly protein TadD